jgi:hypothetical protein
MTDFCPLGDFLSSALVGGLWTRFGAAAGLGFAATFNLASVILLVVLKNAFKR